MKSKLRKVYDAAKTLPEESLDPIWLAKVFQYFPLGEGVRYFVGDDRSVVLDSVIIGYRINSHMVYAKKDVRWLETNGSGSLEIADPNDRILIERVEDFQLVTPNLYRTDNLDYARKWELVTRGGPFRRGNQITVISNQWDEGTPCAETTVKRQVLLKNGFYAGHHIALLELHPNSMEKIDKRGYARVAAGIPAKVSLSRHGTPREALLVDFSECAVRVEFMQAGNGMEGLQISQKIVMDLDLGTSAPCVLTGRIMKLFPGEAVASLDGVQKGDAVQPVELMDLLSIKAFLLQRATP